MITQSEWVAMHWENERLRKEVERLKSENEKLKIQNDFWKTRTKEAWRELHTENFENKNDIISSLILENQKLKESAAVLVEAVTSTWVGEYGKVINRHNAEKLKKYREMMKSEGGE